MENLSLKFSLLLSLLIFAVALLIAIVKGHLKLSELVLLMIVSAITIPSAIFPVAHTFINSLYLINEHLLPTIFTDGLSLIKIKNIVMEDFSNNLVVRFISFMFFWQIVLAVKKSGTISAGHRLGFSSDEKKLNIRFHSAFELMFQAQLYLSATTILWALHISGNNTIITTIPLFSITLMSNTCFVMYNYSIKYGIELIDADKKKLKYSNYGLTVASAFATIVEFNNPIALLGLLSVLLSVAYIKKFTERLTDTDFELFKSGK